MNLPAAVSNGGSTLCQKTWFCHLAVRSSLMLISCKSHQLKRANTFSPYHYGASPSSMPSYSTTCIRAAVFPKQDPSFHFVQSCATVAGTILVQALDPAKMCVQLANAVEEHRYSDIWKLYEQYSGVDEFPRKFIVNKLLRIYGESLESEWLEKAHGWVERALEEGRQNQLEYDTLLYLSLSLTRGGFHVQASTIVRKLVELEQYSPVTA